jgi:hypothetical protein
VPKTYHYRREYVNVRLSKKLYDYLTSQKRYHEPLDRIADRIFGDQYNRELVENHIDIQETIENKDRIIKSLAEQNRILRIQAKEIRTINMKINQFVDDK